MISRHLLFVELLNNAHSSSKNFSLNFKSDSTPRSPSWGSYRHAYDNSLTLFSSTLICRAAPKKIDKKKVTFDEFRYYNALAAEALYDRLKVWHLLLGSTYL